MSTTTLRQEQIDQAREADTQIAAEWAKYWGVFDQMKSLQSQVKVSDKNLEFFRKRAGSERTMAQLTATSDRLAAEVEALQPSVAAARTAAQELDAKLYEGWSRFFLVKHIHSSQHCSSFRWTTRVVWLPDVSGLTEDEAVATHGEALCTICFQSAPTELTTKKLDPAFCTGSGKAIDRSKLTGREGSYYSPTGTCSDCGTAQGLTSRGSGKARKHKKEA